MIKLGTRFRSIFQRQRVFPGAVLLFSVLLFLACAYAPGLNRASKTVGLLALSPLQWGFDRIAHRTSELFVWIRGIHDLREENARLSQLVEHLCLELQTLREESHENETLRGLLHCKERAPFETLPAQVIGRDPSQWFRSIVLDKGTRRGVQPYMPVITPQGLVGIITEVSPFASRVKILMDPGIRVGVLIQETRAEAVLEGRLESGCELRYLARDPEVETGATLVTSGLGCLYPKGIPVGRITRLVDKEEDLFLKAEVLPSVDFSHLDRVLIVLSPLSSTFEQLRSLPIMGTSSP